ncbi:MAG: PAC2 family protein [Candidatus Diapherotrites archaeon]
MINIVEHKEADLSGYTLIEGFPGLGLVGTITANYLVEKLSFEVYAHIESDFFLPIIRVHKGWPRYPAIIYVNHNLKLLVVYSEQIIPKTSVFEVAKAIADWARKKRLARIISLEGIFAQDSEKNGLDKKEVYGIACNEKAKEELLRNNVKLVEEGITSGVSSMLMLELMKDENIISYCLLGKVSVVEDYHSAAICLDKLAQILGIKVDTQPLLKEAKRVEAILAKQMQDIRKVHESVQRFEESAHPLMYT